MKNCTKCAISLDLSNFNLRPNGTPISWCKSCHSAYNRAHQKAHPELARASGKRWRDRNKEKLKGRKRVRSPEVRRRWAKRNPEALRRQKRRSKLRKYGISESQYESMYRAQNGTCATCFCVNVSGRRLAIDHNHANGKVRGLLCTRCNTAIGHIRENVEIMRNVIAYLEKHKSLDVIGVI